MNRTGVAVVVAAAFALSGCSTAGGAWHSSPSAPPLADAASPGASPSPSASLSRAPSASPSARPAAAPVAPAGYPTAASTGYPHGLPGDTRRPVTLTPYTGPMTIAVAGTVIDGRDITGQLAIRAHNVVIRNSRIRLSNTGGIDSRDDANNLLVEDTELDGQGRDASTGGLALAGYTGITLRRVDAHSSGDILRLEGVSAVYDSWLHDPTGAGSAHDDVIQSTNATSLRIVHNRLENPHTQTSCILLKADLGPISDVVVDGNLLNGGGYTFYWYDAKFRIGNGRVTHNRFQRAPQGFWPNGGRYGPVATQAQTLPVWTDNAWFDNGQQIPL